MNGRDVVLGKIRRALAVSGEDETRRQTVSERLANPPHHPIPARGQLQAKDRIDLFCRMAEKAAASVSQVAGPDDVPTAIADYLRSNNLPAEIRMGGDERLAAIDWEKGPGLTRKPGPSDGKDAVGASHAFGGVAETGTLMLLSGPENPTTINLLPDCHVVVVAAGDIEGDYESLWRRLREKLGKGVMPRTVNLITGPSRSADIEQTILLGAHGPRALHVIVVGSRQ